PFPAIIEAAGGTFGGPPNLPIERGCAMIFVRLASLAVVILLVALAEPTYSYAAASTEIHIGYLRLVEPKLTISVLDKPPPDDGFAGAKIAINDDNTTGKFLGQTFALEDVKLGPEDDPVAAAQRLADQGTSYIVA